MKGALNKLTVKSVETTKPEAKLKRYSDGGGLYLVVTPAGVKRWAFLWRSQSTLGKPVDGKRKTTTRREMGLGTVDAVSLAKARELAAECRSMIASGLDPIEERRRRREQLSKAMTFGDCIAEFLPIKLGEFRSAKHGAQWESTLTTYCKPILDLPVKAINHNDIKSILEPHWQRIPETASRLCGRIVQVLDYAADSGHRDQETENPAIRARRLLGKHKTLTRGHHAALPYTDVPVFITALRKREGISSLLLEFTILTCCRTGMARMATWKEIDFDAKTWTLAPERMKAKRGFIAPLTDRTIEILEFMARVSDPADPDALVFPGHKVGRPFADMAPLMVIRRMEEEPDAPSAWKGITPHGFRSSFRDWAGEETDFPRELCELALAHAFGDATEQAYRRRTAVEKRRTLMNAWEEFCADTSHQSNVVKFNGRKTTT